MKSTYVVDASAIVAALGDLGARGEWARATIAGSRLLAPALLPFEVANILRRHSHSGQLAKGEATQIHADLLALPIAFYPYSAVGSIAWRLRDNVTIYDAAYVAGAEIFDIPLVTLDNKLARSPGLRCDVVVFS